MIIHKTHEGAWVISALVDGYLSARTYHFYTRSEAIHEFLQEHNMFEEPTNEDRAERFEDIAVYYLALVDPSEPYEGIDKCTVACILADMMHWCDVNGESITDILDIAENHHAEEQPYVET